MPRYARVILVAVTLACLLPFAGKAFHIDDPLFVWAGRQMQTRWWNPYGFEVNWYLSATPMHEVTKNPPLASGYIGLLSSVFGEKEFVIHLGFLLQVIAAVLGTYALARRFSANPFFAGLAVLFTPAFMVSSTTVMCDVLMLALWVWAVEFWIRGLENDRPLWLTLAGFLLGACVLAKYFGVALIPLLLVYSLIRRGRPGGWLLYLLIPVVIIGLYEWWTRILYGHGLFLDAFGYVNARQPRALSDLALKTFTGLGFTGGGCAIVFFYVVFLWRPRIWVWGSIGAIMLLAVTWFLLGTMPTYAASPWRQGIAFQWSLMVLGGLAVLALPILDWKARKSPEALLLLLWVFGTFAFCVLNWTINVRSILPMVPAVAILLLRRAQSEPTTKLGLSLSLGLAALLSLAVTVADFQLASSARAAATEIRSRFGDSADTTIWFEGHWGFQYYAERNGLRAIDLVHPAVRHGDLIVVPRNNTNLTPLPQETVEHVTTLEMATCPWLATMSDSVGAGFYMDILGPLPFAFGVVPAEKYYILRFK